MSDRTDQNKLSPQDPGHVRQVVRVTSFGLAANVSLGLLKLAAGLFASSQALVADAVHTLSDVSTDLAILIGVRYWSLPADEGHPHGHRRVETVITGLISLTLGGLAVGLAYRALTTISEAHLTRPGPIAVAAACLSIVIKEVLYRWTVRVGKRIRSAAVVANAWHHRSDGLSSIPVALAVAGAMIYPSWSFLDHIGAVVVSVFLSRAAWRIASPALRQLVDGGAPERARQLITVITAATPKVERVHAVRTRYLGPGLQVDLHILVDGGLTVREGHDVSEAVKSRLMEEGPDVLDVVVHLEPSEEPAGPQ